GEIREKGFIDWMHPEDRQRMMELWESLFTGGSYSDVEFRLISKTGEVKWSSSTWGPLFDEAGRQIGVQGRERDITERKQLEQELLQMGINERRRIGHDLHDSLCQYLAVISFKAKTLEQSLAREGSAFRKQAQELASLLGN